MTDLTFTAEALRRPPDPDRQTGRTARQMQAANWCAYFIVAGDIGYYSALKGRLGRNDLRLRPVSWLDGGEWRALDDRNPISEVIIDHWAAALATPPPGPAMSGTGSQGSAPWGSDGPADPRR